MGNHIGNPIYSCGCKTPAALDPHQVLCRRACGTDEAEEEVSCDPAGAVFEDTSRHLGELERLAFHFAGSSNLAALRWLFVFGANHQVTDSNGTSLLHAACRTGSLQVVKDLVRRGLPIHRLDNAGWSALHVAACIGRQDVALYLVESGSKLLARTHRGQTAEDLCSNPFVKQVIAAHRTNGTFVRHEAILRGTEPPETGSPPRSMPRSNLHFEPFFVPREAMVSEPAHRALLQQVCLEVFNRSPGHGIALMVAAGVVRDYPVEINTLLVRLGACPGKLGDFLGEEYPISQTLRLEFLNSLQLLGTGVVGALEVGFHEMAVPTDWLKIDRLTCGVAHFWWKQHEEEFAVICGDAPDDRPAVPKARTNVQGRGDVQSFDLQNSLLGADSLHRLMFSALMLRWWLQSGHDMSLKKWIELNTGIEGNGTDVPVNVQSAIYSVISKGDLALSKALPPQPTQLKPTVGSWAFVRYSGRAVGGKQTPGPLWPEVAPQQLAEQGGASVAGRSMPSPPPLVRATEVPEACQSVKVLAEDFDAGGQCGEAAWVTMHGPFVVLSGDAHDTPPYAFVSLRHVTLREAVAESRTCLLGGRNEASWNEGQQETLDTCPSWLELCLLLGDGRFQALEAPRLELRFETSADYESWHMALVQVCGSFETNACADEEIGCDTDGPKADLRMPTFVHGAMADDAVDPEPVIHQDGNMMSV